MNVTPSSKVDVGDVSVSEESSTAAEQLKTKKKQIECVSGKFTYDRFGIFVWSISMLLFSNNLSFSNA